MLCERVYVFSETVLWYESAFWGVFRECGVYLVEFKGHPMSLAEWLPAANLDCPDILSSFIASCNNHLHLPPSL